MYCRFADSEKDDVKLAKLYYKRKTLVQTRRRRRRRKK
jgi:hypothetical protein